MTDYWRCAAAESVCLMFGWTSSAMDGDREKALHELWGQWASIVVAQEGEDFLSPQSHPELSDEVVTALAALRDATRERTLNVLRSL